VDIPKELFEYRLLARAVLLLAVNDLKRRPEWTEEYSDRTDAHISRRSGPQRMADLWLVLALLRKTMNDQTKYINRQNGDFGIFKSVRSEIELLIKGIAC